MSPREARQARNEALFREVNERIVELAPRWDNDLHIVCECAMTGCTAGVVVPMDDYKRVRGYPRRFFVLHGHVDTTIEHVVERTDAYDVVEKYPDVEVPEPLAPSG